MLTKFSVENFKGFKDRIVFDLGSPNNYNFNKNVIIENCVSKGTIYGFNGCGKSNLGLAIFDIIIHLTEKQKLLSEYEPYLNLDNNNDYAQFEYYFIFNGHNLEYKYKKTSATTLLDESLKIDGEEVIAYDYIKNHGFTSLRGSETLNNTINTDSPLSRVKYVSSNSILENNSINKAFLEFINFVERMLLFYSLDTRGYEGFTNGTGHIADSIVKSGKLELFQKFLSRNNINYKLLSKKVDGINIIFCNFKNEDVDFMSIASTGTRSLALFYYWYIRMQQASFVFIDEYDAFYHFELAENVQNLLNDILKVQIFTTTHNTDLMSNELLRPDCFFVLNNNKITSLSNLTEKELRFAHNLQKMYKSGAFNVR